ncbi:sterigmatocystin 8-O-methyltransferase precursor [Drechmeria coniospora]|uniref:Sterigmatocystin 8-O-methyltransferase n=1 Tax=Drechmeria coniospora TaxID=98403 RepID=A0A151GHE1_DRECN|nr:sterigmatocystin 8-O-methyltransferase precursor [Drechmeria coniospora]KYK56547.1 sterigmatocystin 8-O-methyltransferase precursor [Drechmeria coniospora]
MPITLALLEQQMRPVGRCGEERREDTERRLRVGYRVFATNILITLPLCWPPPACSVEAYASTVQVVTEKSPSYILYQRAAGSLSVYLMSSMADALQRCLANVRLALGYTAKSQETAEGFVHRTDGVPVEVRKQKQCSSFPKPQVGLPPVTTRSGSSENEVMMPPSDGKLRPAPDLSVLVAQLELVLGNPEAAAADDAQRLRVRQLARSASTALEQPFETLQRIVHSPLPLITTRIAQEHKIHSTLVAANEPVSFQALKKASGLEEDLLGSILDYLSTQDMVQKTERGKYAATRLSRLMTAPLFQDAVIHFHDSCLPGFAALNTVLCYQDKALNAFQTGQHSRQDYYTWLESHPVQRDAFHRFMEAQFTSLPTWLTVVDFAFEMGKGLTDDDVAFVDVGGGNGQQCSELKQKLPQLRGRVVLQDRPDVLVKATPFDGVEKMSYDYLTEQPVKGARVYYFRQILHNNDDETCIRILASQLPAMAPDSVIVIDDKTLPDDNPPQGTPGIEYVAGLSIAMKVMFNSRERRESHWRELLGRAGLVVKDIRRFTRFEDSVIIAAKL